MPHLESPRAAAPHHCLRLTGSLSSLAGSAHNLVNVRLGNNSLRGVLPINMTTNSQLLNLELYDNVELYGTLPDMKHLLGLRTLAQHLVPRCDCSIHTRACARLSTFLFCQLCALQQQPAICTRGHLHCYAAQHNALYVSTQHSTTPFMSAHSTAQCYTFHICPYACVCGVCLWVHYLLLTDRTDEPLLHFVSM
jgi:hypothetical protein